MSIASELGKLIGDLNQGVNVGTLQFLGSAPGTVAYGGGNFIKQFYDTKFIPHINYFRKGVNEQIPTPKPILLRDKPRRHDRGSVIRNRVPAWKEKELSKNGYINWDSFLDEQKIMSFDFAKQHPGTGLALSGTGVMISEDPFTSKENFQKTGDLKILKQGVDLSSMLLGMMGVCPKMNPYLKRLAGFELAKALKKSGMPVTQQGSWILLKLPETTSGFFGNMIKKTVREIKNVGKRIQDGLLNPIRNWMKSQVPAVWKTIDKLDRSVGITASLKKFSCTIVDLAHKYGERVMSMAVMAAATIAGGPAASIAAGMILKVADKLSTKEKKALNDVIKAGGDLEKIDKTELKELTVNLFGNIKDQLIKAKGKEGANDFQKIINMARETINATQAVGKEVKKTISGIGMTLMPLTQYNSFVLGSVLKGIN